MFLGRLTSAARFILSDRLMSYILYLGDTSLATAAAYLAGVLHQSGWSYDYLPSDVTASASQFERPYRAYILSDYMAVRLPVSLQEKLIEQVARGAGLLMIGGWESYHGLGGDWDGTPVAGILPVEIADRDDRVNCDHPVFVRALNAAHSITRDLPFEDRPPLIGGYNRFKARGSGEVLLQAWRYSARFEGPGHTRLPVLTPCGSDPLLVVGVHGHGRVAALATDAAPHWVGPWVDWGSNRVKAQGPGASEIEVGHLYAQFFRQLVAWTGGWGA